MGNRIVFYFFVAYLVYVKKSALKISPLILFVCALTSCLKPSQTSFPSEDPHLIDESEMLVNFTKGERGDFYAAHGYSNGRLFNCDWSRDAVKFEDSVMSLNLTEGSDRFYGGEYRSRKVDFHYGYYATKMKPANCPGVISSFFTYTNSPVWDEIDIEFLGKDMSIVQFNYYTNGEGNHEYIHHLKFDASKEFHEYGFEWLEDSITWYVDGVKVYRATENIPTHPQTLMMNLWNCKGNDSWSGAFDSSKLPVKSEYQFIGYIPAE